MEKATRLAASLVLLAAVLSAFACGSDDGNGGGSGGGSGPNLVENPGAEQDAAGYVGHGDAAVAQDITTASEGLASVKVAVPGAQGAGVQVWKADGITMTSVSAGADYTFAADIKGDQGRTMRLEILWHGSDGTFQETSLGEVFFLPADFQTFTLTAKAPEGAGLAVPQIVTDVAPNQPFNLWLDDVRFRQGSGVAPDGGRSPGPTGPPSP